MVSSPTRLGALVPVLCALALAGPPRARAEAPQTPRPSDRAKAIDLYDEGRYEEARSELQALDVAGKADGSILYRLSFCQAASGDQAAQVRTLQRAIVALEKETAAEGAGIEPWFYLANAYRNQGNAVREVQTAREATGRLESRKWPEPTTGVDRFRIGKLYADQSRTAEASLWYRRALEAFAKDPHPYPAYAQWSHRYLGDTATEKMDWAVAEQEYAAAVAAAKPLASDYRKLAVARLRAGRWGAAADAWREMERLDPANGDDPRYARQLALQAAALGSIPVLTPDGRTWDQPSQADLEKLLADDAKVALDAAEDVKAGKLEDPAFRASLEARLEEAHGIFVAAGIEYAARGLPIRETAFSTGYAPLIFHPEQWKLPAAGQPAGSAGGKP